MKHNQRLRIVGCREPVVLPSVLEATPVATTSEDDPNPRGLPIYHPSGVCTNPDGGCRPRIQAGCRGCGRELNLCYPSSAELRALISGAWRCADCSGVAR